MALGRREFLGEAVASVVALVLPEEPPQAAALSRRAARALRTAVRGPVFLPRTPGYNSRRLVYNTRFDGIRPDAVVLPRDTRDVQAVVRWADRFDIRLVSRSGGHSYAGYSTTDRGVVVDLRRLRGVRVSNGRATVGPATPLIDVYSRLARNGLLVPAGTCPTVAIAGLALGGGHGLSGRRFGVPSHRLPGGPIVTARGRAPGPRPRSRQKSNFSEEPLPRRGRELMIEWIERRQRAPSQGSGALLLDSYGGALNRPRPGATAFVHRDMLFSLQYLTYFSGSGQAANRWINGVWRALRPYVSGQAYQNYIDPQLDRWQRAYYGSNLERLREVKAQVDPDFRFRFRQA